MIQFDKSDFKQAGRALGYRLLWFFLFAGKILLAFTLVIGLIAFAIFLIKFYFWQLFTLVGMTALAAWFYIELLEAKALREYEDLKQPKE